MFWIADVDTLLGFPGGSDNKEFTCNVGDLGSILGLERSLGEGNHYPLQCSGLENSMDCIVHGVARSWTWLSNFHLTHQWFLANGNFATSWNNFEEESLRVGRGVSPKVVQLICFLRFSPVDHQSFKSWNFLGLITLVKHKDIWHDCWGRRNFSLRFQDLLAGLTMKCHEID